MSKKKDYHLKFSRIVNGNEFSTEFTVKSVKSPEEAEQKLKRICKEAGGPEPVITSIQPL